jgi:hypothetical protein
MVVGAGYAGVELASTIAERMEVRADGTLALSEAWVSGLSLALYGALTLSHTHTHTHTCMHA